jgi:NAD(P)H dehydrogenase (quinone)
MGSDVNNLGDSVGTLLQSPADAGAGEISTGDLESVELYAARVAEVAGRLYG